jgi:hypothetical protein
MPATARPRSFLRALSIADRAAGAQNGGNNIPFNFNFALPLHETKDVVVLLLYRNEFGHGFAALSDDDCLALGRDLVHDGKATRFEHSGGDGLGFQWCLKIMVILPWSYGRLFFVRC